MNEQRLTVEVDTAIPGEARLAMRGDVDIAADETLADAYAAAAAAGATRVILDFANVDYINSTGIALIVRLLAEARRDHREVIAVGLSDHYREIFRITRLSDYLVIADTPVRDARHPQEAPDDRHHRRRRAARASATILRIHGEITGASEPTLMDAYGQAPAARARSCSTSAISST